ncbi:mammalian cell entry-like domain protein [Candidatus Magnetoovum chiemensis]|nr:mammalian cell entry-like domain protein [Candidatus Magnetoovum chiemensis]
MPSLKEEVKAGFLILLSLTLISVFVIAIGAGSIKKNYDIYFVKLYDTAGIDNGSSVRIGGVRVGKIIEITAPTNPDEKVLVKIGLKSGFPIYKGTKAAITQIGFVGEIYMHLYQLHTTKELIKPGSTIPSEEQIQMGDIITQMNGLPELFKTEFERLSSSTTQLINNINRLFSDTNIKQYENLIKDLDSTINTTSSQLNRVADSLVATTERLQKTIDAVSLFFNDNKKDVKDILTSAKDDLAQIKNMALSFKEAAVEIKGAAKTLDSSLDTQTQNLDVMLNNINETSVAMQELIEELKHKPWSVIYKESGTK